MMRTGSSLSELACLSVPQSSGWIVDKPHLTPSELEPDSLGLPAMPLAKRAFFSTLFKPLRRFRKLQIFPKQEQDPCCEAPLQQHPARRPSSLPRLARRGRQL